MTDVADFTYFWNYLRGKFVFTKEEDTLILIQIEIDLEK
ncbi:hypothetical protein LBBP_02396 [Leptospira borgpetersenii serovar Ballum]|uniref:Uncharacterized protein n=1 Tax=Leptospira borgpetersenii serovar Ballum TaxID=280505 RepID=A0A0S2ISK0_LEPBO|nr:hypothetical protein LBBP_02396 [Leptospira borgpetersenii serovar Ballum]